MINFFIMGISLVIFILYLVIFFILLRIKKRVDKKIGVSVIYMIFAIIFLMIRRLQQIFPNWPMFSIKYFGEIITLIFVIFALFSVISFYRAVKQVSRSGHTRGNFQEYKKGIKKRI